MVGKLLVAPESLGKIIETASNIPCDSKIPHRDTPERYSTSILAQPRATLEPSLKQYRMN